MQVQLTGITTFTTSIYDAVGGKIQIGLSTTQTAALKPGRHVYDVITTNTTGVMECVVEGMVISVYKQLHKPNG